LVVASTDVPVQVLLIICTLGWIQIPHRARLELDVPRTRTISATVNAPAAAPESSCSDS
jgi:hypothetical protein